MTGELRTALRDKSNIVVAAAATIIGDQGHTLLAAELEAAFQRHMVDPLTSDKLCRARSPSSGPSTSSSTSRPTFLSQPPLTCSWSRCGVVLKTRPRRCAAAILALFRLDHHGLLAFSSILWLIRKRR